MLLPPSWMGLLGRSFSLPPLSLSVMLRRVMVHQTHLSAVMCGIFAYLNYKEPKSRRSILRTLLEGLKYLEYRGCDSAGLSIDDDCLKEGVPVIFRQVGKVDALDWAKGGIR